MNKNYDLASQVLMSFRYVSKVSNTKPMIQDLFSTQPTSLMVYPADVVELRRMLSREEVMSYSSFVPVFALRFAERYLNQYPLFVVIDMSKISEDYEDLGGVRVYTDTSLHVNDAIRKVIVNQPVRAGVVVETRKIIKETMPTAEFIVSNSIPGISPSHPRLSKNVFNLTKQAQVQQDMPQLQLTPLENKIFSHLNEVNNRLGLGITMRVAGGWVRDKILGEESDDIDIAIDKMSGYEFAKMVGGDKAFSVSLEKSAKPKTSGDETTDLMVGGINLFGLKVEFVPMRTERYEEGSRTPIITRTDNVEEDVLRRDLTINAMYYNINTGQVEDYIGGREDLQNMVLRTPSDPVETFTEDPLRMLRAVRFYAKYPEATFDPELYEALQDPLTHKAYNDKVHLSRASKELRKIFASDRAMEGAAVLFGTDLYKPVFQVPEDWNSIMMDQQNPYHDFDLMKHTLEVINNIGRMGKEQGLPEDELMLLKFTAFGHDFAKMHPSIQTQKTDKEELVTFQRGEEAIPHMQYKGHESEGADFWSHIMKEMQFKPEERKFVETVVLRHMEPHEFEKGMTDEAMGRFLKDADKYYSFIMTHAHADALSKNLDDEKIQSVNQSRAGHLEQLEKYRQDLGDNISTPMLDGNRIQEIAKSVDPEMVSRNAMFKLSPADARPTHYVKFVQDRLLVLQWQKKIQTLEDAAAWAKNELVNFAGQWRASAGLEARQKAFSGKDIIRLIPELNPQTGFIGEVNKHLAQFGELSPEESEQKVLEWKSNNLSKYLPDPPTQAGTKKKVKMNWYGEIKKADASSASPPGTGEGFHAYQLGEDMQHLVDGDIVKMKRKINPKPLKGDGRAFSKDRVNDQTVSNDSVQVPFVEGDRVRRRSTGLAHKQEFGKVVGIKSNMLQIQWDGKKKLEEIPLNETIYMAHEIEKV